MDDSAIAHYNNWFGVILWILIYGVFIFFIPFYKKSQRKPTTAYMAFVVAYAFGNVWYTYEYVLCCLGIWQTIT